MASVNWIEQLPGVDTALTEFPDRVDDDVLELHDVRVTGAIVTSADVTDRPEVVNVALDQCDIAGFTARDGRASRVLLAQSRLRGVTWMASTLEDLALESVTGSDVSVRFSTLRRVVLRDCELPGLDFTETTFDRVRLESCDLRGARFDGAKVKDLRIEGCDLAGCTGAEALAGASVHPDDLLSLAPSLARALGITLDVTPG